MADQVLTLEGGRRLGYLALGPAGGRPVIWHHGGLSCRTEVAFAAGLCDALEVRLLAVDRPGIGTSDLQAGDRQPGRTLPDLAGDVAALADHLGLDRFAVVGWSAGGPYALACAARLGDRVTRVMTLAGMAPIDRPGDVAELGLLGDRLLFPLARRAPRLAGAVLGATRLATAAMIERTLVKGLEDTGDPDAALLRDLPGHVVSGPFFDALAPGGRGTAEDYRLLASPWGFDLGAVRVETHLWQGERDGLLPPSHARRLADAIPGATLRLIAGQGHFIPRRRMREVLEAAAAAPAA